MTSRQLFLATSALIALGGLGLLAIATCAAINGVWSAATFIGLMGVALLSAVVFMAVRRRRAPSGVY